MFSKYATLPHLHPMKALQKLQRAALLAVALLGSRSAVQALTSSQAGAWTDVATWGGTAPAFSTPAGVGDCLEINHAITVGSTNVSVSK